MTQRAQAEVGSEQAPVLAPLAVLVSCALLVLMQLYLAIPLAPVMGEALGGGGATAPAALGTAYALAYGLGFLVFGPLSDRYGRKVILVPGMAALAIATAGLSAASSLPMVALLRSVQGLLAASFAAVALAYVGEALPPRWRSTGIGAVSFRPGCAGFCDRRARHRRSSARAGPQRSTSQFGPEIPPARRAGGPTRTCAALPWLVFLSC